MTGMNTRCSLIQSVRAVIVDEILAGRMAAKATGPSAPEGYRDDQPRGRIAFADNVILVAPSTATARVTAE